MGATGFSAGPGLGTAALTVTLKACKGERAAGPEPRESQGLMGLAPCR